MVDDVPFIETATIRGRLKITRREAIGLGATAAAATILPQLTPYRSALAAADPPSSILTFADVLSVPPFSFTYGGTPSSSLLASWPKTTSSTTLPNGQLQTTVVWTDPGTGLQITWMGNQYPGSTTFDWSVLFTNTGSSNSSVLANVLALDLTIGSLPTGDWTIHTASGSNAAVGDFAPLDLDLSPSTFRLFTTNGGRPTDGNYLTGGDWQYLSGTGAPGYINSDQRATSTANSSASLTFTGTSVSWIGPRNVDCGISKVFLDGIQVATVDLYAASWLKQQVLYTSPALPNAEHTVEVVCTATKNASASGYNTSIDAFQYITTDPITVNDNDPAVGYSTGWTHLTGSSAPGYINTDQHATSTPGATATLTFTGTTVSWIGPRNVDCGISHVLLDGVQVATVDLYASSWLKQQVLYTSGTLTNTTHTIQVVATATKNAAATDFYSSIDAFNYISPDAITVNDADPRVSYINGTISATNIVNGWPYYNLDFQDSGLVCALGWPGQWGVETKRVNSSTLNLQGGMTLTGNAVSGGEIATLGLTNLWLAAGESIRTPLVVVSPWSGTDSMGAQNLWRRWMTEYHMPRSGSGPAQPLCPTQANDYFAGQTDAAADELTWMNAYGSNHATAGTGGAQDHWWIDAGWYQTPSDWTITGTWTPDPTRFPGGLKPVTDRARALGMAAIVWFEPERVMPGTDIANNYPSWLLSPAPGDTQWGGQAKLFNFGNPAALSWAISFYNNIITTQGIDFYREDFNIQPLGFWQNADPVDRQGITQAHYVKGHLDFWAGLQAAHPGMLIDSCASGGRRLDILTLSYAINLLRSDDVLDATSNQSHVFGISPWVTLHGGAVRLTGSADDVYNARSAMGPSYHEALQVTPGTPPWTQLNSMAAEWQEIASHYLEDFYRLTPYSTSNDQWLAWQFGTPADGVVQAFRRPSNALAAQTLPLFGLDPGRTYQLHDLRSGSTWSQSGISLTRSGVAVSLPSAPLATTITYTGQ